MRLARHLIVGALLAGLSCLAAATATSASAAIPAHTDVMFLLDTSTSMGSELAEAKEEMLTVMSDVNAKLPDVHYGVARVEDYPRVEEGVLSEEEIEASEEKPWELRQPLTSDVSAVQKAVEPLQASGGGDAPESYGRALWETDTNPNVGWREGARHIVVLVADNVPHDDNLNEGLPESAWTPNEETGSIENPFDTGNELPGKWAIPGTQWTPATNLDFQSIVTQLGLDGKPLEDVDFAGEVSYLPYWEYWAGLSGGHALGASEKELAAKLTASIETGATSALPPCPAGEARDAAGACVSLPSPSAGGPPPIAADTAEGAPAGGPPSEGPSTGSAGQSVQPALSGLANRISVSKLGTIKGSHVEIQVGCELPCAIDGQLYKDKPRPVQMGSGTLTLSQGGKGTLIVKLSAKARRALSHAGAKGARLTLKLTIRTAGGAVVGVETRHVTVRSALKKGRGRRAGRGIQ